MAAPEPDRADELIAGARRAELERCRAVSEADWSALDALLADDLTHTHMNGRVDDKRSLIDGIRQRPRTLRRGPLAVRLYGEVAIMTGPQYLDLGEGEIENQATQVWRHHDGGWVLHAFHASTDDPRPRAVGSA